MTELNDKYKDSNYYIINTVDGTYKKKKGKEYKTCWNCGKRLPEGSLEPFCSDDNQWCYQEYYRNNNREIDSVWREIVGRD